MKGLICRFPSPFIKYKRPINQDICFWRRDYWQLLKHQDSIRILRIEPARIRNRFDTNSNRKWPIRFDSITNRTYEYSKFVDSTAALSAGRLRILEYPSKGIGIWSGTASPKRIMCIGNLECVCWRGLRGNSADSAICFELLLCRIWITWIASRPKGQRSDSWSPRTALYMIFGVWTSAEARIVLWFGSDEIDKHPCSVVKSDWQRQIGWMDNIILPLLFAVSLPCVIQC